MKYGLIVAIDKKGGIGKDSKIPWNNPLDLHFFRDVTRRQYSPGKKNVLIMGYITWKSLPMPSELSADRIIVVISSKGDPSVNMAATLKDGITVAKTYDPGMIFFCGGERIYRESLQSIRLDHIYITSLDQDYACDTFFPISYFSAYNYQQCTKTFGQTTFYKYSLGEPFDDANLAERQYLDLLENIITHGHYRQTRNGFTWSTFGKTLEFDLGKGFPLLTTKKMFFRGIVEELLFFLKGKTDTNILSEKGVKIWEPNTRREFLDNVGLDYKEGDMGPMYGFQLMHYNAEYHGCDADYKGKGFDQLKYCLDLIKTDPYSRRIIMTTYNPLQAKEGCLFPCHGLVIMFNVEKDNKLSCMMTQRSADMFLGVPFNIASYALLVHLICGVVGGGLKPGRIVLNLGDAHVYESHYESCARQILREGFVFPQVRLERTVERLEDYVATDITLDGYMAYDGIMAKMVA